MLSTLLTTYTYTNRFLFWRQSDIGPKSEMRKLTFELFKFWRLACSSSLSIFLCELGNFWTIKRFTWSPSPHYDQHNSAVAETVAAGIAAGAGTDAAGTGVAAGTEIAVEGSPGVRGMQLEKKDYNDGHQHRHHDHHLVEDNSAAVVPREPLEQEELRQPSEPGRQCCLSCPAQCSRLKI